MSLRSTLSTTQSVSSNDPNQENNDPNLTSSNPSEDQEKKSGPGLNHLNGSLIYKGFALHQNFFPNVLMEFMNQSLRRSRSYNVFDRIAEVKNGSYAYKCFSSKASFEEGDCILELINKDYIRNNDGVLEVKNPEIYEKHKALIGNLLQELKSNLLSQKGLTYLSLPMSVCEPRSMLERIAGTFVYAPTYLARAAQSQDPLEQFKLSLAHWVAALHTSASLLKPFTPMSGETLQVNLGDNCSVHLEELSYRPPICAFQLYGDAFKLEGSYEFHIDIGANKVKAFGKGYPKVTFLNTKTSIYIQSPVHNVSGVVFGTKTYFVTNKCLIFDLENGYYTEINFEASQSWFGKKAPLDTIGTSIWKVKPSFIEKLKNEMERSKEITVQFQEKEDALEEICKLEGSWLEYLNIDKQRYWTFGKDIPAKLRYPDNALPSDSNFRLDILHLKGGDEKTAQENKIMLQEIELNDQKVRTSYKKI